MTEQIEQGKEPGFSRGAPALILVFAMAVAFFLYCLHNVENFNFSSGELVYYKAASEGNYHDAFEYLLDHESQGILQTAILVTAAGISRETTPLSLRFASILFASLSILLFFFLAKEFFPDGLAFVATALFTLSPTLYGAALDAGPYALFLFTSLLLFFTFANISQKVSFPAKLIILVLMVVCFDITGYAAVCTLAGLVIVIARYRKWHSQGAPETRKWIAPAGDVLIYSTAAFILVYTYYLASSVSIIPPSSIFSSHLSPFRWASFLFVGAVGGVSKTNSSLAIVVFIFCIAGTYHIRKARPFSSPIPILCAVLSIIACTVYFSTGRLIVPYAQFTSIMGFTTLVVFPFVTILSAAGIYYFIFTNLKRDALSVFTIKQLFFIAVSGISFVFIMVFFGFFTVKGISQSVTMERESWPLVSRYLSDWVRDGDVLMYHWEDSEPVEHFILPRIGDRPAAPDRGPATWLLKTSPAGDFSLEKTVFDRISAAEGGHVRVGLHANINTLYIDGIFVPGSTDLYIQPPHKDPPSRTTNRSDVTFIECKDNSETCSFNLYFPEDSKYLFSVEPDSPASGPSATISLCDSPSLNLPGPSGTEFLFTAMKLKTGYCKVEINYGDAAQKMGYNLHIHKNTPTDMDLFYIARF